MNIVDSSGWLEFFADGPLADNYAEPLSNLDQLLVPAICIYEVFKVVLRERNEDAALQAVALMQQGRGIDLSPEIAMNAAKISLEHKIPMADSIIFSTALLHDALIWTQDKDFQDLPNVKFFNK